MMGVTISYLGETVRAEDYSGCGTQCGERPRMGSYYRQGRD